jgi:DNA (cytosine-5)-methyltransferase 1
MLQPHELAAAMGFDGYEFAGTKTDQVRQIGNAVAVRTAEALCGAMMDAGQGAS